MLPAVTTVDPDSPLIDEVRRPCGPCRGKAVPETVSDELVRDSHRGRGVVLVGLEANQPREKHLVGNADGKRIRGLRNLVSVGEAVAVGINEAGVGAVREDLVVSRNPVSVAVGGLRVLGGKRHERYREWRVESGSRRVGRQFRQRHPERSGAERGPDRDVGQGSDIQLFILNSTLYTLKVVAVFEVAVLEELGLNAHGHVRLTLEQDVAPRDDKRIRGSGPEPDHALGVGLGDEPPVRLRHDAERRMERRV